ncbi:ABC transporter permease subunit [Paralcaligenes ureilyticus]|uniref:Glutamate/aspartate import permease protein GltK n=1 Tax=Paralcaligenes ureilyticus TaxID=627131 RepID=A0A4R3M8R2_9BURK|nr:ABC transporter permease subunit [Paralcaligenes ureilyticus]TCT08679.1 L-glutamate ABC transporter membrane protein /L-aspartate ABC transporter membrane protein [Paralcaligenes ureilyticus]
MFEIDWNIILESRALLFTGMWVTLKITAVAVVCGLAWGTVLAMCSIAKNRFLTIFAQSYVSLFRSIPLIMLLLWFFLIVPQVLKAIFDLSPSVDIRLISAMVAFSLLEAAFFCEIMRAGIQSLPMGQFHAAKAVGMTPLQSMRYVILPQAFKAMLPIVLTQCIVIFQDTSLVYVIALGDFFRRATSIGERDGTIVQMLIFAGVVYWIICSLLTLIVKLVQQRTAHQ